MNSDALNRLTDTLQISRELIRSNKELIKNASSNTSKGIEKIQNVYSSLEQLHLTRQKCSSRINAFAWSAPSKGTQASHKSDPSEIAQHMLLHDIRGPIGRIASLIQIIGQNEELLKEVTHLMNLVAEQSQKVQDHTQTHSIYHQLEQGIYQPENVPFDLLQLCREVQCNVQEQQFANPITMRVNRQSSTNIQSCTIEADAILMKLMLQNLVQNAIEASPCQAPVQIDIDCVLPADRDHQELTDMSPATCISIHNQGVIPEIVQDKFFEKFATYGKPKGTGLGTYIAMLAARSLGGTITFITAKEQGTTLKIHLPNKRLTVRSQKLLSQHHA